MSARRCAAMPTGAAVSLAVAGGATRRTPSAVWALSRGEMLAGARVDQVDAGEIPSCDAQSELQERAVRGRDFEAHAFDGDGAIAATLNARDLGPERSPERVGAGAFAADAGAAQVSGQWTLANLGVLLALVFFFGPRLGGGVEQVERQRGLALEHGQETALDLAPERFLFSILFGRIGQRRMVDDAQALEPLDGLGGEHRGAVVGQKSPREFALLKRLRQGVNENLGGLFEVPLQVAAEPRAVVENAE